MNILLDGHLPEGHIMAVSRDFIVILYKGKEGDCHYSINNLIEKTKANLCSNNLNPSLFVISVTDASRSKFSTNQRAAPRWTCSILEIRYLMFGSNTTEANSN